MDSSLSYILNELGEEREHYYNAVTPPIFQTSNFAFESVEKFREAISNELDNYIYTRGTNPTVAILRKKIAALEGTEDALIFSSGSAAISMTIMNSVKQGDHVICVRNPYSWTSSILKKYLSRFGVEHTFVDATRVENIIAVAKPNTKLLFLESPCTFTYELQDLEACAKIAKERGWRTAIDNSYASPLFQQPAKFGIDIVIHSASKYLNGHSDVVGGVVCSSRTIIQDLFSNEYMTFGAIMSPNDAFLMLRSLRSLPIRMERISNSTKYIVEKLKQHPQIEKVLYPFDPDFPQYELAKKQMTGCSGLFTIAIKAPDIESVIRKVNAIRKWKIAVSWGGHEALMMPLATFYNIPGRDNPAQPWNYVRFSVGFEDPQYLLDDLYQALEK